MRRELFALIAALICLPLGGEIRRDVEYARPDGDPLTLDASIPIKRGVAGLILVHGGGWSQGNKRQGIEPLASVLTAADVAWFSIDYRLAPDHPHPAALHDVAAAVAFVVAHADEFHVDRRRIFLAGFSAGGHLAALAATATDVGSSLAGALSFYGRMDLVRGYSVPGPAVAAIRGLLGLDPNEVRLRDTSPIYRIRPGLPPFLIVHGTADTVVPFEDSRRMCAALQEARNGCQLIPIPGGGHGMSGWASLDPKTDFIPEVLRWLSRL